MTDVETRTCWKCGKQTPLAGTYCEHCGVHRNRNEQRPDDHVDDEAGPGVSLMPNLSRPTTITAAGVLLMATVMLLVFWFWVAILAMAMFWEPDGGRLGLVTFFDYIDGERSFYAAVASLGLTFFSWVGAASFAEAE